MDALFYSNGMDVFGPVSYEEFSKNRYYRSTLIWYEGLAGWIRIGECKELQHLIGSLVSPEVKDELSTSVSDMAPPLSARAKVRKQKFGNYTFVIVTLSLLFIALTYYAIKQKASNETNSSGWNSGDKALIIGAGIKEKTTSKDAEALRKIRLETEMKTYRMNWEKFIIATPEFKVKSLGGISNLKIIIKNNSPYLLDSMKVKVAYLKANGETYHKEIIRFDHINSGNNKSLYAPNSDRGVKVNCTILSTHSNAMQLCFNRPLRTTTNADIDIYHCMP